MSAFDTDVIVVGGGGAALAAASAAAQMGRRVILLEKSPQLGGSTAWSVGSVSATQTPHQKKLGIEDHPDYHWEDMKLFSGPLASRDNFDLARVLADNTPKMFEWLLSTGLEFVGPLPEPPHRLARMHNVLPNSRAFPYLLGRHCRSLGVEIRLNSAVSGLIRQTPQGAVIGVTVKSNNGPTQKLTARLGVVLACGDYSGGRELKAQYGSELIAAVDAINVYNTGDGIRMGMDCGSPILNGDHIRGPILRFIPPKKAHWVQQLPPLPVITRLMHWGFDRLPKKWLRPLLLSYLTTALAPEKAIYDSGAILVDLDGLRFTNECDLPARRAALRPQGMAHMVFDHTVAEKYQAWPHYISTAPSVGYAYVNDYRRNRKDIFHCAPTIRELAHQMNVSAGALEATIHAYNSGEDQAEAPARGLRPPIITPPFYALGPAKAYIIFTNGGLKVSHQLEVLNDKNVPIPGLYAAGANGQGGMLLEGHGHHLGWAFVSGRIAGRQAALFERPSE